MDFIDVCISRGHFSNVAANSIFIAVQFDAVETFRTPAVRDVNRPAWRVTRRLRPERAPGFIHFTAYGVTRPAGSPGPVTTRLGEAEVNVRLLNDDENDLKLLLRPAPGEATVGNLHVMVRPGRAQPEQDDDDDDDGTMLDETSMDGSLTDTAPARRTAPAASTASTAGPAPRTTSTNADVHGPSWIDLTVAGADGFDNVKHGLVHAKPNPLCIVSVLGQESFRTKHERNTRHPMWNVTQRVDLNPAQVGGSTVKLVIVDRHWVRSTPCIGVAEFDAATTNGEIVLPMYAEDDLAHQRPPTCTINLTVVNPWLENHATLRAVPPPVPATPASPSGSAAGTPGTATPEPTEAPTRTSRRNSSASSAATTAAAAAAVTTNGIATGDTETAAGYIDITVVEATGFESVRHGFTRYRRPDPLVVVCVDAAEAFVTPKQRNTCNPVWDHTGRVRIEQGSRRLRFLVYDHYTLRRNILCGTAEVDPHSLEPGPNAVTLDVENDAGEEICQLSLLLVPDRQFLASPAPAGPVRAMVGASVEAVRGGSSTALRSGYAVADYVFDIVYDDGRHRTLREMKERHERRRIMQGMAIITLIAMIFRFSPTWLFIMEVVAVNGGIVYLVTHKKEFIEARIRSSVQRRTNMIKKWVKQRTNRGEHED